MIFRPFAAGVCGLLLLWQCTPIRAQDQPAPYPRFLSNFYAGVQAGYVDYPFSNSQVQPGFHAQGVQIPHLAVRVFLFGHEFNKYLSAQISDMRPVYWVHYQNVNGDQASHSVWMNIAGLTAKSQLPLSGKFSIYGEGGLGIVTRRGFAVNQSQVVNDASYATLLFGAGVQYQINDKWRLLTGLSGALGHAADQQPRTLFVSGGFNYIIKPHPSEPVGADTSGTVLPKNLVQVGYMTDVMGFGANNFVSKGAIPIFWTGEVYVTHGLSFNYQRNLLHTRRFFALDWGAGVASWKSRKNGESFYTASVYPVIRFTPVRARGLDFYFNYSLAGPSLITSTTIDDQHTGKRFTFQDFIGAGIFVGRKRRVNAEVRIQHYSNGNLFPQNAGVTIPLGFYAGTSF